MDKRYKKISKFIINALYDEFYNSKVLEMTTEHGTYYATPHVLFKLDYTIKHERVNTHVPRYIVENNDTDFVTLTREYEIVSPCPVSKIPYTLFKIGDTGKECRLTTEYVKLFDAFKKDKLIFKVHKQALNGVVYVFINGEKYNIGTIAPIRINK